MNNSAIISFSKQSARSIHDEAMAVAKNLKSEYQRLFEILLAVELRKLYFEFEIPDLKTYCMEMLELSSSVAKEFGIVVRKSLEVPQLAEAIHDGKISIYKARRISSVINESNSKEWIDLAVHCSSRIVEKAVAHANPRAAAPESLTYVAGDVLELKMGVSEEWAKLLERSKDLLSQKSSRVVSAEEALFILMREHCRKNDPLEKAIRAEKKKLKNVTQKTIKNTADGVAQRFAMSANSLSQLTPNTALEVAQETVSQIASAKKSKSRYLPAEVEHQVDLRDECQCTHIDGKGNRCPSRRWLQKHHIIEFSVGGEHTVENLITLCWAHHKIKHLKSSNQSS